MKEFPYQIRAAYREDWEPAMQLAWNTFLKFEAGDFLPEGVRNFKEFIADATLHRMFLEGRYQMFVAMDGARMIGMITMRGNHHISLLFVEESYHRQGVGRELMQMLCTYLLTEMGERKVTVDAAPYGNSFYHHMGFRDLGPEISAGGIRYTPMEFIL